MLPKKNRADRKVVEKIFKRGIFINSYNLSLKYIFKKDTTPPKVSFIVPKTVEKTAVKRNFLKRNGYVVLKKYLNKIPNGFVGVFIFNKKRVNNQNDIISKKEKLLKSLDKEVNIIFNKTTVFKKD